MKLIISSMYNKCLFLLFAFKTKHCSNILFIIDKNNRFNLIFEINWFDKKKFFKIQTKKEKTQLF
jgi:hypothetical protein